MNNLVMTFVLAFLLMVGSTALTAQTDTPQALPDNVPGLLVKANEAFAAKDYLTFRKALESLYEKRPNNSEYMYQLVIAHALLDEKTPAYELMLHMQAQGLAYDFTETESSMNIRNTEVFTYVNDLMKAARAPVGKSETVFTLPDSVVLPESIAWDESRQTFLIGTLAEGSILAVGMDGQVNELLKANKENGLWAVIDIMVDRARNRLWVTSAAIPVFSGYDPVDKGRSALFEFSLDTLKLIRRHPVPVDGRPHILGSMVLGPNGDIFVADRSLPLLYSKPAAVQKFNGRLAAKDMISMRGSAIQPDGKLMYVADRELGILVVDINGGRTMKLVVPETLNIGGIDGLYLWENHLIVIQNGIRPQRVMRLQLDASGTQVVAVRPLAVAQSDFDDPNFGTIHGEYLYYFANSQSKNKNDQRRAVTVLRTPLDSNENLAKPDMEDYFNQRVKKVKSGIGNSDKEKSEDS